MLQSPQSEAAGHRQESAWWWQQSELVVWETCDASLSGFPRKQDAAPCNSCSWP